LVLILFSLSFKSDNNLSDESGNAILDLLHSNKSILYIYLTSKFVVVVVHFFVYIYSSIIRQPHFCIDIGLNQESSHRHQSCQCDTASSISLGSTNGSTFARLADVASAGVSEVFDAYGKRGVTGGL
jgi:hypothetical protein